MIDCFLCTCATDPLRIALAQATLARLKMQPELAVKIVRPIGPDIRADYAIDCTPLEFRLLRRKVAEEAATTPIYLITDDDVLPYDMDFVNKALRILSANPEFKFGTLRPHKIDHPFPDGSSEIAECDLDAIGGCNFIYKGIINEWPTVISELDKWTNYEPRYLRARGYKAGAFRNLWLNHIGAGFSLNNENEGGFQI